MSEEQCTHDCSSCSANCGERQPSDFHESPHEMSHIRRVVGVMSGKGGVGKSAVSSMLAVACRRLGMNVGILDADVTGPSIPKAFGITARAEASEQGMYPVPTKTGIELMSLNLLMENPADPVVWRGPVIAGLVKQFWTDVLWGELDVLFIDMPPGTGDVPLTVFQTIHMDGVIVVTSPQELVGLIVEKAVRMAGMLDIPVLALVENMSYLTCPDCGKVIEPFGPSRLAEEAAAHDIVLTAKLPLDPSIASLADKGLTELYEGDWLDGLAEAIQALPANDKR